MLNLNKSLKIGALFILCLTSAFLNLFLQGCSYCVYDDDNYLKLTNTISTDITVEFRYKIFANRARDDLPQYEYFSQSIPANETIEMFLERIDIGDPLLPTPGFLCNNERRKLIDTAVDFTNDTLSQFTICMSSDYEGPYKIQLIGSQCENGLIEQVEGF